MSRNVLHRTLNIKETVHLRHLRHLRPGPR